MANPIMILVDGKPWGALPDTNAEEVLKAARDAGDVTYAEETPDGWVPVEVARDAGAQADLEAG